MAEHTPEIVERVAGAIGKAEDPNFDPSAFMNGYHKPAWTLYQDVAIAALDASAHHELVEALWQLLDDMGEDGLCVCQDAKDQAIAAYKESGGNNDPR